MLIWHAISEDWSRFVSAKSFKTRQVYAYENPRRQTWAKAFASSRIQKYEYANVGNS